MSPTAMAGRMARRGATTTESHWARNTESHAKESPRAVNHRLSMMSPWRHL